MTSMVEVEQSDVRSVGVGEKRLASEDGGVALIENEVLPPPQKRIKRGSDRDLKKVAEMVLVLSAMGKMRGGRGPTVAEKELMGEARNRLAKVCENFAPKEVYPKEAFGSLIDDLGLNKLNEQRIGFRPPKISIADKLLISKRKMEKAEDLSLQSAPQSAQRLQGNSGAVVESHTHSAQKSYLGNSNRMSISASPVGHVTPSSSTAPSPYQLPTSEIRPTVATASHSSHLGVAALPRVNRPPTNGPVHPSQVQVTVNHSANSATSTPTWTVQHHPVQPANVGSNNKLPIDMSISIGGPINVKSGLPSQVASRTVITQTTRPPSQGTNYAHALPVQNAHTETAKIVQKLLQPKVSECPIWDPPSRDYMNKALTCQMCTSMVTDTDSVLICDVCEKGYHLKCLQITYQKSFAGEEWHCGKCLSLSNGKPLPPKYGRVLRNTNTPKMSYDSSAIPLTKRIDASDVKGDNLPENLPTGVASDKSGSKRDDAKEIEESANDSSKAKRDDMSNMMNSSLSGCVSSMDSSGEKLDSDKKTIDTVPNSSSKSNLVPNSSDKSQVMVNGLLNDEASPSMQSLENNLVGDSEDTPCDETLNNAHQPKDKAQEVMCDNPSKISTSTGVVNKGGSSPGGLRAVSWVGDPTHVLDEKIFYESCRINEHLYKAMNYVLVRFEDDKIVPSKLQVMWEDKNTTTRWVTVNPCYFPGDLPEAVGRPCGLQSREVYESTKGTTLMAGLIESPCEVLPPRKFEKEIERRTRSGTQTNVHLPPLYLCKWIYDEAKGLFRDISC